MFLFNAVIEGFPDTSPETLKKLNIQIARILNQLWEARSVAQGPPIGTKKGNPNLAKCDLCGDFHRKSHWEQERASCKKRIEARYDCRWCSFFLPV